MSDPAHGPFTRAAGTDVRIPAGATGAQAGDHTYDVWAVETLLTQPQVLAGLTAPQGETLLSTRWSWADDDHSGIEAGTAGIIRSTWGMLPLMEHPWGYRLFNDTTINKYYPAA